MSDRYPRRGEQEPQTAPREHTNESGTEPNDLAQGDAGDLSAALFDVQVVRGAPTDVELVALVTSLAALGVNHSRPVNDDQQTLRSRWRHGLRHGSPIQEPRDASAWKWSLR